MREEKDTNQARAANRVLMPTVAKIVDEYRAIYPDAKVVFAAENGFTLGQRPRDGNAFCIPPNYRKPAGGWPR